MSIRIFCIAILSLVLAIAAWGQSGFPQTTREFDSSSLAGTKSLIKEGFDLLYTLKFEEARGQFYAWRSKNPVDPLSDISIAASYLFEEFYHQRVLTSDFFLDNRRLFGGIDGKPDEHRTMRFDAAYKRGRDLAIRQLEANPDDPEALFALTLATGMRADYTAVFEKEQNKSLHLMKEAGKYAKQLLELRPDAGDAWLAIGASNYLVGSLPAIKRFFLWISGSGGDKTLGMEQLRIAAETGFYLKPFAKIFLALAALREKQEDVAREQLSDLVSEYPGNHLFSEELARLNRLKEPAEKSDAKRMVSE